MAGNLPCGVSESDIDRTAPVEEPEYELTEADLDEAYLEALELSAPVNQWAYDEVLIDARIRERLMERWAA